MVGVSIDMGKSGVGKRHIRRPTHTFNLKQLPFVIQPFLIAPVLPGETMRSLMFQARVVSDPLLDPLVGWHAEYYFFYVKHRDLANRDNATEMMINPAFDIDTADAQAAAVSYYHSTTGISWTHQCLRRVVEEYFRHEGEAWDDYTQDSGYGAMPIASIGRDSVLDSMMLESQEDDVDIDFTDAGSQDGVTVTASEVEAGLQQYQFARMHNLTDMTYEDYLKSYGIQGTAVQEPHKPELIRFIRQWTYPTNTVNPADGAPSSAVSWAVAEKADKDRFFREPGFIFGVCVFRPKVYLDRLSGGFVDLMNSAMTWLPGVLENEPRAGRVLVAGTDPPLLQIGVDAVVDIRDLLMYGDQFLNYTSGTPPNGVTLPEDGAGLNHRYPLVQDSKGVFVDSAGTDWLVRSDGVVNLQIATRQMDVTPSTAAIEP